MYERYEKGRADTITDPAAKARKPISTISGVKTEEEDEDGEAAASKSGLKEVEDKCGEQRDGREDANVESEDEVRIKILEGSRTCSACKKFYQFRGHLFAGFRH